MRTNTRFWLTFSDLSIGDRFMFAYGATGRTTGVILQKTTRQRYVDGKGRRWVSGPFTAVVPVNMSSETQETR